MEHLPRQGERRRRSRQESAPCRLSPSLGSIVALQEGPRETRPQRMALQAQTSSGKRGRPLQEAETPRAGREPRGPGRCGRRTGPRAARRARPVPTPPRWQARKAASRRAALDLHSRLLADRHDPGADQHADGPQRPGRREDRAGPQSAGSGLVPQRGPVGTHAGSQADRPGRRNSTGPEPELEAARAAPPDPEEQGERKRRAVAEQRPVRGS